MDEKETPRGVLSEHVVKGDRTRTAKDVKLAGALYDIEYNYMTLGEYIETAPAVVSPLKKKEMVARAMNPNLNGEAVDWDNIEPSLGLALIIYMDKMLSEVPSKNC